MPETHPTPRQAPDVPVATAARKFDRLTADEARRALYIDFEGEKDKAPVLLGTLRRRGLADAPKVHQVVTDPVFAPAGPEARGFRDALSALVRRAEHKHRRIVAWSEYELDVVRRLAADDPDLVARFEGRYVNARAVAERWTNRLHRSAKPATGKLVDYLAFIDYPLPPGAAGGDVADTIRSMRPTLEAGRPLTANQLRRWARLLEHNQHDCAGMRAVCLLAAEELERTETRRRLA